MTIFEVLQKVKRDWGIETVAAIKQKIQNEGLIWQGELLDSIGYTQAEDLDGEITFKMAEYGKFQDEGVNGEQIQHGSQFSFRGKWQGTAMALTAWAAEKGLNKWAVARTIQRDGIRPKKFFNDVIASRIEQLGTDITKAYADYLTQAVQKNTQQNA